MVGGPKCLVVGTGIKITLCLQSVEYWIAMENPGDVVVVGIIGISKNLMKVLDPLPRPPKQVRMRAK